MYILALDEEGIYLAIAVCDGVYIEVVRVAEGDSIRSVIENVFLCLADSEASFWKLYKYISSHAALTQGRILTMLLLMSSISKSSSSMTKAAGLGIAVRARVEMS